MKYKQHTFQSDISRESQRPQHDQTLTWSQHSWPKSNLHLIFKLSTFYSIDWSFSFYLPFSSACVMRYVYNRLWHPNAVGDGGWTNAPCTAVEIFASPKPHVTVIQMIRNIRGCLRSTTVFFSSLFSRIKTRKIKYVQKKRGFNDYHLIISNEHIPNENWIDAVATVHNWN